MLMQALVLGGLWLHGPPTFTVSSKCPPVPAPSHALYLAALKPASSPGSAADDNLTSNPLVILDKRRAGIDDLRSAPLRVAPMSTALIVGVIRES
jgi:hypothetical protein